MAEHPHKKRDPDRPVDDMAGASDVERQDPGGVEGLPPRGRAPRDQTPRQSVSPDASARGAERDAERPARGPETADVEREAASDAGDIEGGGLSREGGRR